MSWTRGEPDEGPMHRTLYSPQNSYRKVPTFGRDTIRRFARNSSEMKKMAAHDFEDLLQVRSRFFFAPSFISPHSIPVCNSGLRGSSSGAPQHKDSTTALLVVPLAWAGQTADAHGRDTRCHGTSHSGSRTSYAYVSD